MLLHARPWLLPLPGAGKQQQPGLHGALDGLGQLVLSSTGGDGKVKDVPRGHAGDGGWDCTHTIVYINNLHYRRALGLRAPGGVRRETASTAT